MSLKNSNMHATRQIKWKHNIWDERSRDNNIVYYSKTLCGVSFKRASNLWQHGYILANCSVVFFFLSRARETRNTFAFQYVWKLNCPYTAAVTIVTRDVRFRLNAHSTRKCSYEVFVWRSLAEKQLHVYDEYHE